MSNLSRRLDTCGCCEGIKALTPVEVQNLPGLSALAYRVGTHAGFKMTMQSALSGQPPLRSLTTRDDGDPTIALCDGWATVLDVLSFYQERIANEGYLKTATERRSILEMARSIGYELRPGVAASTYLAFTIETAPGSPSSAKIGVGTKAQSMPGQDQLPQIFETIEDIEARAEWNGLKPRLGVPLSPSFGDTHMYLKGVTTHLKPGDPLLIVGEKRKKELGSEKWEFRRILEVKIDARNDLTRVSWDKPLGSRLPRVKPPDVEPKVYALRLRAAIFGHNAVDWNALPVALRIGEKHPATGCLEAGAYASERDFWTDQKYDRNTRFINLDSVYSQIVFNSWIVLSSPQYAAELYRVKEIDEETVADYNITAKTTRLRISGEHIEKFSPRSTTVFAQNEQLDIAETPLTSPIFGNKIELNEGSVGLERGRLLIVSGHPVKYVKVADRTRVFWHLNWEVVDKKPPLFLISVDSSKQKELKSGDVLDVVGLPEEDESNGHIKWHLKDENGLTGFVTSEPDDFLPERAKEEDTMIGRLESTNDENKLVSEAVTLDKVVVEGEFTTLVFATSLQNVYHRDTVIINANVAKATHGETKKEILGSGDSSQKFQKFALKQKPLTYVSAATPSGAKSTLEVRVNDLLWEEVATLDQQSPKQRAYTSRLADDGKVTVQFGDGKNGVRPSSGTENISATYRVGTGTDGMVKARQISMLITRALGVKGVVNPLAPLGAADPEKLDEARRNAPLTVLTFDRIVSLQDYEDFANAFAGIGKAQANMLWDGEQRVVHITVAGADGHAITEDSDPYKNLLEGIDAARHPTHRVKVAPYVPLTFNVTAKICVDSSYIEGDVLEAIRTAVENAFSFEKRSFGQAVTASEVQAVIQKIEGVVALDLDELYLTSENADVCTRLPVNMTDWEVTLNKPAKLLTVNPQGITFTEMNI